jgi:hypothetical protein
LPKLFGDYFSPYVLHRAKISNILDNLAACGTDKPDFVFAHILAPHPPFVFGADGSPVKNKRSFNLGDGSHYTDAGGNTDMYLDGYINQVRFINSRMTGIIKKLIDCPQTDQPIIIIMGDHGPGSELSWTGSSTTNLRERFSILYALYLPGQDVRNIPVYTTPVNTFRYIFRDYFQSDWAPLINQSYYATWNEPYDLVNISTDRVGGIHEYMLGVYKALSPGYIEYRHICHPKEQGYPSASGDCYAITTDSLFIKLHKTLHSDITEYSVDGDDVYTILFRYGVSVIAAARIEASSMPGRQLRAERARVPQPAIEHGFDNIVLIPQNDDPHVLGHIRFAGSD